MEKSKKDDSNKNDVLLKNNYHYNLWEIEKGGAKTRYKWNVEAIKTLKRIEKEERMQIWKSRKYFHDMQDGEDYRKYLMKKITYGRMNIGNKRIVDTFRI